MVSAVAKSPRGQVLQEDGSQSALLLTSASWHNFDDFMGHVSNRRRVLPIVARLAVFVVCCCLARDLRVR